MSPNLSREWHRWRLRRATAHKVTPSLASTVEDHVNEERPVFQVRPYPADGGVHGAISLLDDMHRVRRSRFGRNHSETNSYEIWHEPGAEGVLSFNVAPGPRDAASIYEQLMEDLPNSEVRQRTRQFPRIPEGWHVAAARSSFFKPSVFPIRHVNIDGFSDSDGGSGAVRDPYKSVLTKVGQEEDVGVAIQTVFKPTTGSWREDSRRERASARLRSSKTVTDWLRLKRHERDPTDVEQTAAKIIEQQQHAEQFGVSLRLLAWAEYPEAAERRLQAVARALGQYYESHTRQGIAVKPAGVKTLGLVGGERDLRGVLRDTAERRISTPVLGTPGEKTVDAAELAGLVHAPDEHVNHAAIDRSQTPAKNPVPPRTPRFDFEALDEVDDAAALTPRERFRLMVRHGHETPGETDDAVWIGEGTRTGTEAGIPVDDLLHLAINGKSGHGKSKEALAIFYQMIVRGHGAFYADPKDGEDALLAVGLAMLAGRGDDVVPIRVGADSEYQVTFNFLEVPGQAEPGTAAYLDKLEPLSDVIEGVLAQAGGTGRESWGERMSGLTRHIVRGIGQLELESPATLMTLNYAGATKTDRERYSEYVHSQNVPFIEDTADSMFSEYDDGEIEPWARRLNQVVESAPLRDIACNPHGVSITEIIREGKIPILFGETASDTALKMLMTAWVPSIWTVKQELSHSSAPEDADIPPFHAFVDELNDIVTDRMDLPQILSNARSYDFHLHGIYQNPDAQTSDEVTAAFEGQADTLSVNPGTEDFARSVAAHHSEDVGHQALLDLPEYRQYLRTTDFLGERTWSYSVNLGHPITEIEPAMPSEDEIRAHVEALERDLGSKRRTPAQIKADDPFAESGESTDDASEAPDQEAGLPDPREDTDEGQATKEAVVLGTFDAAIRAGEPEGHVALSEAAPGIRRRLTASEDVPIGADAVTDDDLWREAIRPLAGDAIATHYAESPDDGREERTVRAVNPQAIVEDVGTDQSAGGPGHSGIAWDSYIPLTYAGLTLRVNRASGSDADAVARAAPDPRNPELVERLLGPDPDAEARVELEHTTGTDAPAMTSRHCLQAQEENRPVIYLARPGTAQNVADTVYADPPLCRSNASDDDEVRYYTGPRAIRAGGEEQYRPSGGDGDQGENVWIRERDADGEPGDIVLRDTTGTEHARFSGEDAAGAVLSDPEPYPSDGENRIMRPLIPENYDVDGEPAAGVEIVEVPTPDEEDATLSLADLELVVDADGHTLPATLDVPDRAADLLRVLLAEADGPVTKREAGRIGAEADPDLDASRPTVNNWINALADAGVLVEDGTDEHSATRYRPA